MCRDRWHEIRAVTDRWILARSIRAKLQLYQIAVVAASLRRGVVGYEHGDTAPWLQLESVVCRFLPTLNLVRETRDY